MYIVSGEEMRQVDRFAIEQIGLGGFTLMENAGSSCSRAIERQLKKNDRIAVVSGGGNNGGDGFVIARYLAEAGFDAALEVIAPREKIHGEAYEHLLVYESAGRAARFYETDSEAVEQAIAGADVIIDAMLGTGVTGELKPPYKEIAALINRSRALVFAVDLPSGVPSAEAADIQAGVCADRTYMLAARKMNASLPGYRSFYGTIVPVDIGIPELAYVSAKADRRIWLDEQKALRHLPHRDSDAHKGQSGRAAIIGGSMNMSGAVMMAAEACVRAGAGRTTAVIPDDTLSAAAPQLKEAMYLPLPSESGEFARSAWRQMPEAVHADGVAVGPGLGRNVTNDIFPLINQLDIPIVIDADALLDLASDLEQLKNISRTSPVILTPHPGEMAVLTGLSIEEVQAGRFSLSAKFAKTYGVYLVLKGRETIITGPDGRQWVNSTGNAGLAKGGTGDVLTGMILAFLLQYEDPAEAVFMAVYLHGLTADYLAERADQISINASDISHELGTVICQLKQKCNGAGRTIDIRD
ncbi:NAD(P)H-hydrate dehydratase [Salisediminibacterium halotolerans]|uniref:NAD(P)H-hydrate dehydratase n=1 Tax=Salisediminibacterium halotolerans TaxID=517425 RepID=UPI000EB0272C|nr:NAD(P)H-hydrate dehydratase [Salisediminibacterium halotolerans]RLJ73294.1 NAD(P)H-hydrate epimerase [Actinophytocola xinjiangensis]RPE86716.1 NAD(P)H-hydrate epimerase [Salisediminibacterium halotolerans]TWG34091.1 NAD(P)H-hydrate epimerase [Salisediminibacterium halotolerans]GEL07605.1 bifunctional NAD(P)H-hydrate repair enzyme [Salisediminibacterium halotolerans]